MASRRIGGKLQFAKLWEGGYSDWDDEGIHFDRDEVPFDRGNAALNFLKTRHDDTSMWEDPFVHCIWRPDLGDNAGGRSILKARIHWYRSGTHEENDDTMDLWDAACCLEHYVAWPE